MRGHLLVNTFRFALVFHMKTTITEKSKIKQILRENGVGAVMTIIVFYERPFVKNHISFRSGFLVSNQH